MTTPSPTPDAVDEQSVAALSKSFVIGALIVALVAVWLIVRNAADQMFAVTQPELAMAVPPASGLAQAEVALNRVVAANGTVDGESRALLHNAARAEPLLAEPFVLAGLDASAENNDARARALFKEAQRRDPRSVVARYWLFDDAMQNGDYTGGLSQVGAILALQPLARPGLLSYLTALLKVPAAKPALTNALRQDPNWRNDFFEQATSSPDLVQEAADMMSAAPSKNAGEADQEQQLLIMALFRQGDFATARRLWLATLPPLFQSQAHGIYDGNFLGWPGSQPFNWRFPEADSGIGVPPQSQAKQQGLQVHFNGDSARMLAVETLMANPGKYILSFTLNGLADNHAESAGIEARVYCDAPTKKIGDLMVDQVPSNTVSHQLPFAVPDGCKAITVQLRATPGISPGPLDAAISNVALAPQS